MKKGYCHIDGKVCTINFCGGSERFVEHLQIGKQIGKLLDMPKRPQAHFLGLEYEESGNLVPNVEKFEKYQKDAHNSSVQNGCDAFPNELMRF